MTSHWIMKRTMMTMTMTLTDEIARSISCADAVRVPATAEID